MLWAFLSVMAVGLFWLGYRHPRRRRWLLPRPGMGQLALSTVDRQHKHLLAGGRFGEATVEATTARFRELLLSGRSAELEHELHPGMNFALQVQALARIGTAEAGVVLERQLSRQLSRDPIEQAWYWVHAASGLRQLHYSPALPALLRCTDKATELQPGIVLASEVVAFPNFQATLKDLAGPLARPALRALTLVARGCRDGTLEPGTLLTIGVGDILAVLSNSSPPLPDPWLTSAILEAERLHRRIGQWKRLLERDFQPLAERQGMRLWETTNQRSAWLKAAPKRLIERFSISPSEEQRAILQCLFEFRTDVIALFPYLPDRRVPWWGEAVRCMKWSQSVVAGPVLARQVLDLMAARKNHRRAALLIETLRGHPGPESEGILLRAAGSINPELRQAAAAALGWWPPINTSAVIKALQTLRTEAIHKEVRHSAVGALARLGLRTALQEIREELFSEEAAIRTLTVKRIAHEELSWLWPDLQDIVDSDDTEPAFTAIEAIEQLRENALKEWKVESGEWRV